MKMEGFSRSLAFLVAVDRYGDGIPALRTPVADAETLAEVLRDKHGFKCDVLKDEQTTVGELRAFLKKLPTLVGSDDRVIFYFAGHGIAVESDDGPKGFILPQDAKRDSESNYLPMAELDEALSALPCRHMLLILDCCFAGAFRWSSYRYLALSPENLHQERYNWFIEDPAWQAVASAAHDQKALDVAAENPLGKRDDSQQDHSPFARALIDGLKGQADRAPVGGMGDGVITATELYQHIDDQLRLSSSSKRLRQTPILWPLKKHDKGQFVFLVPGKELNLPPAPPLDPDANPWRGLSPYEEKHKELFYGRGTAADRLAARLLGKGASEGQPAIPAERFIVVTGPSGSGKSSLVKAGLLPRLPKGQIHPIIVRPSTPGPTPFAGLAAALMEASAREPSPDENTLQTDPDSLTRWVKAQKQEVLLVIDQAEELITMNNKEDVSKEFIKLISNALDDAEQGLRVVFTIRSEFEPQFAQSPLKDHWAKARYLVPQMTQDELRRVIEGPAAVKVMRFESVELVDKLINEVVNMPGALPLLSFALSQMYRHYLERRGTDRAITQADYDALQGGVTGALRIRANQVVDGIDELHQQTARRVLERFVSIEAGEFARRRVPQWEFEAADADESTRVRDVLIRLTDERLVVTDEADGTTYLELAHDALILSWDRLVTWVRHDAPLIADLRRLTPAAKDWARPPRRNPGLLFDDAAQVASITTLQNAKFPGLNHVEQEFAQASVKRNKRNRIIWWSLTGVLALLTAGASGAALYAVEQKSIAQQQTAVAQQQTAVAEQQTAVARQQTSVAQQQREEADRQADEAKRQRNIALEQQSGLLAETAREARQQGDTTAAVLLNLASLPDIRNGIERPIVASAAAELTNSLYSLRELATLPAYTMTSTDSFSKDDASVLVGNWKKNALSLFNLTTRQPIKQIAQGFNANGSAIFSPEGDLVAAASRYGKSSVWSSVSGDLSYELEGQFDILQFDSASSILVAYGKIRGDYLKVFDKATGHEITAIRPGVAISDVALSPDGFTVALATEKSEVQLFNTRTGRQTVQLVGHRLFVNAVKFSPDAQRLVTASGDGTARIWDARTGEQIMVLERFDESNIRFAHNILSSVAYSPDGKLIATGSKDGIARLWDSSTGQLLNEYRGHTSWVNSVSFSRSGKFLVTGSQDRTARVWDVASGGGTVVLGGSLRELKNASFSHDGRLVITTSSDNTVRVWNWNLGKPTDTLSVLPSMPGVDGLAFSSDGLTLMAASLGSGEVWQRTGIDWIRKAEGLPTMSVSLTPSDISTREVDAIVQYVSGALSRSFVDFASPSNGPLRSTIRVKLTRKGLVAFNAKAGSGSDGWSLRRFSDGSEIQLEPEVNGFLSGVDINMSGSRLLLGTSDSRNKIQLWNADTGTEIRDLEETGPFTKFKFSQGGERFVTVDFELVRIWDSETGGLIRAIAVNGPTNDVTISRNDDLIAIAIRSSCFVYSVSKGELISELKGHTGDISSSAFDSSGTRVVTTSRDGSARVWKIPSGHIEAVLEGHSKDPEVARFSEDGRFVATAARDRTIRIWRIFSSVDEAVQHAKQLVPRCFSEGQLAEFGLGSRPPTFCSGSTSTHGERAKWPYN